MQSKQQIQLNEKDSLQDMLNLEKEIVKLYSTALTEGNGSKFRTMVKNHLVDSANDQFEVFTQMAENNYYEVKKLNIKESEVNKVLSFNDFTTTDAQYDVYIIYKNGKVHILHDASEDSGYAFKNYKVNDLRVSCKKRGEFGCETVNYKLTLQNGTEKTVTKP